MQRADRILSAPWITLRKACLVPLSTNCRFSLIVSIL